MRNCKMARVASVLGLVMLSVALLILSLISYVSLKKENIFTTPKYANPGAPRMYMFHAGFRYWKNKHLSPKRLSTGILMYTLASAICEEIHLYGFWPFGFDPNTREDLPYHYYDKKGTKFTTKWQESHQLPAEFQLLYRMHGEGLTKLTLSRCA
ncbi:hypothetical protein CB1_000632035 [Camelus ferus]|nr:hypothetical protein CB1_000632035 [Camelus ferus]